MKLLVKCESVRGIRDAKDKLIGEAVSFQAVHSLELRVQPSVVAVNITEEDPSRYGKYKLGDTYHFTLIHVPKAGEPVVADANVPAPVPVPAPTSTPGK